MANIANAVQAAVDTGATGCLVTDWGDRGHLQPLPVSLPGFLTAACFSWNACYAATRVPREHQLTELLDAHALHGAVARPGRQPARRTR